ncbi:hypothetical protein M947_10075 [Sulfurimonas hongkongensis]|uniref:Methyltransferase type 11 domain-containing protein n=1 Tax=Sulfurimonas hongkongensis TaxID=1172190 RepID=T0KFT5_9BACT|nr:class I SAM-dependent methyltransferase [Sulfurimonas hongkongensis]EQB35619.1 hypothetical protein M947_10075 [Sulfurimonas hongkongensis]
MYEKKATNYFQHARVELLNLIPVSNREGHLLEVGAAEGNTLIYAKEHGFAKEIYGVELCEIANSNQDSKLLCEFIIGNIENMKLPFLESSFDVILCGDVLEHLVDPYTTLQKLKKYLKDDGVIIASLPNIREWKTMKKILFQGDFRYENSGILDKTHLRFFTKKNIIELFENQGFFIKNIISSNTTSPLGYLKRLRLSRFIMKVFFEELITDQYYVVASKKTSNMS